MSSRLLIISLLGCTLYPTSGDTPVPPVENSLPSGGSAAVQTKDGKIIIETEKDGKKDVHVIDLTDPATAASMQGKMVVTTEINGKRETRIVDFKDADKHLPPLFLTEKLPVRTGPVTYLGVATTEVPRDVRAQLPDLPPETGLLIGAVAPESPAAKAGLQECDVLCRLGDQILVTPRQLAVLIGNHKEGDVTKLTLFRRGKALEIAATLGKNEAPVMQSAGDPLATFTRGFWAPESEGGGHPRPARGLILPDQGESAEFFLEQLLQKRTGSPAPPDSKDAVQAALLRMPEGLREEAARALRETGALPGGQVPVPQRPPEPVPAPAPASAGE